MPLNYIELITRICSLMIIASNIIKYAYTIGICVFEMFKTLTTGSLIFRYIFCSLLTMSSMVHSFYNSAAAKPLNGNPI